MNAQTEFAGRVVIVTGGSKGIGRTTARLFAERGASVILVARSQEALRATMADLPLQGDATVAMVAGDVGYPATASLVVKTALERYGRIDILANIAGIFPTALLADTTDSLYSETIGVNLTGTFFMCRAVMPVMMKNGSGSIVNMSSIAARVPVPGLAVYCASKAAIEAFTRAIAAEGAPSVRVNAVSAGPAATETAEALTAVDRTGAVDAVTSSIPLRRRGRTEEISEGVVFLASSRASFITGEVLQVNGGGLMA
jgi:NAD(P)-dependent dehydrogenase (short-subunit alcohol dehydrogenase family)